jgi:hypothetical protein
MIQQSAFTCSNPDSINAHLRNKCAAGRAICLSDPAFVCPTGVLASRAGIAEMSTGAVIKIAPSASVGTAPRSPEGSPPPRILPALGRRTRASTAVQPEDPAPDTTTFPSPVLPFGYIKEEEVSESTESEGQPRRKRKKKGSKK